MGYLKTALAVASVVASILSASVMAHVHKNEKSSIPAATAYIVSPKDGAIVAKIFKVTFGLKGMDVSPAGIKKPNSGHHHLMIDAKETPNLKKPLGATVTHFGKGQTETELTLASGTHTLQLILGDYLHTPHDPAVISKKITITVK